MGYIKPELACNIKVCTGNQIRDYNSLQNVLEMSHWVLIHLYILKNILRKNEEEIIIKFCQ